MLGTPLSTMQRAQGRPDMTAGTVWHSCFNLCISPFSEEEQKSLEEACLLQLYLNLLSPQVKQCYGSGMQIRKNQVFLGEMDPGLDPNYCCGLFGFVKLATTLVMYRHVKTELFNFIQ